MPSKSLETSQKLQELLAFMHTPNRPDLAPGRLNLLLSMASVSMRVAGWYEIGLKALHMLNKNFNLIHKLRVYNEFS